MAFEEIRSAVAPAPVRPARNALISNVDNPAAQQYAQVSAFTSFLDSSAEQAPVQSTERPSSPTTGTSPSFQLFAPPPQEPGSQPASALNYNASGTTNSASTPGQPGRYVSLSV